MIISVEPNIHNLSVELIKAYTTESPSENYSTSINKVVNKNSLVLVTLNAANAPNTEDVFNTVTDSCNNTYYKIIEKRDNDHDSRCAIYYSYITNPITASSNIYVSCSSSGTYAHSQNCFVYLLRGVSKIQSVAVSAINASATMGLNSNLESGTKKAIIFQCFCSSKGLLTTSEWDCNMANISNNPFVTAYKYQKDFNSTVVNNTIGTSGGGKCAVISLVLV